MTLKDCLAASDEFELEFFQLELSRAMKVPSQAELGHFNFRAETELTICMHNVPDHGTIGTFAKKTQIHCPMCSKYFFSKK